MKRVAAAAAFVAALSYAASPARAGEGFFRGIEIDAGTDFPVSVGAKGVARFPLGLQLTAGVGFMPDGYAALINSTLVAMNAYNQQTADLIGASLANSLIVDVAAGWDPGDPGGFFVNLGYMVAALGGKVSKAALLQSEAGVDVKVLKLLPNDEVPVSTTAHNLTLSFGWRFIFFDHLSFTAAAGVFKTIASSTSAEFKIQGPLVQAQVSKLDSWMNDIYLKYVVSPFITVNAGYILW